MGLMLLLLPDEMTQRKKTHSAVYCHQQQQQQQTVVFSPPLPISLFDIIITCCWLGQLYDDDDFSTCVHPPSLPLSLSPSSLLREKKKGLTVEHRGNLFFKLTSFTQ